MFMLSKLLDIPKDTISYSKFKYLEMSVTTQRHIVILVKDLQIIWNVHI